MLLLGACLWWVAHRQTGLPGASAALGLFISTPLVGYQGPAALGALGLFGMVYTSVGVAHALQGPRRKWVPRLTLMAALTAFTAAFSPVACAAGLLLALLAMLYLAEGRRRLLPTIFAGWAVTATLTIALVRFIAYTARTQPSPEHAPLIVSHQAGLTVAVLAALAFWCGSRRARYFGNSAPLLAALLLSALSALAGPACFVWALPFALVFTAGCCADSWNTRSGHLWAAGYFLACAWQFFASF